LSAAAILAYVIPPIASRFVAGETAAEEFVWIDMEGHGTVDATLSAYETLAREFPAGWGSTCRPT